MECSSLSSFLYYLMKTKKLFDECVIFYFHYLKRILKIDLFKEYINLVVVINLTFMLKIYAWILIKNVYRFNWLSLKYML